MPLWAGILPRGLVPVRGRSGDVAVDGFVTAPLQGRGSRSMQVFFVNGRFIKSQLLTAALEEGYRNQIMKGKFPGCVLAVTVPVTAVDVNVHPAKLEVRFVNEKPIFDCVYYGVKTALQKGDTPNVMHFPQSGVPSITPVRQEVKTFKRAFIR